MGQLQLIARALTIAGSDPVGGAGIQQDLKTFAAFGVWGLSAISALTVQDTKGVIRWEALDPEIVAGQIDGVLSDVGVDAAKTGMLGTAGVVEAVARALDDHPIDQLVIDPVLSAGSGHALSTKNFAAALNDLLLPRAMLITPNAHEAAALSGLPVRTLDEQKEVAVALAAMGPASVLVTGGHIDGPDAIDVLFTEGQIHELRAARVEGDRVHGTGCALSAMICAGLARGESLLEAIRHAKRSLGDALLRARRIGKGAAVLEVRA
jgi:hydroxymethylpyrimidine/phosphomethylpyrimidine kinase